MKTRLVELFLVLLLAVTTLLSAHAQSAPSPPARFLSVQSKNPEGLGLGKILVATRELGDPNFMQTVILLVRYDAQGVVGLVLNRRSNAPISRVLDSIKGSKDRSDLVYLGGPVQTSLAFGLFQSSAKIEEAEYIFGEVYLISAKTSFEQTISTKPDPKIFHAYIGYAGWSKEQLKKEVELGSWFIFPADTSTVFNADPDSLWSEMIHRTELNFAANPPASGEFSFAPVRPSPFPSLQ